MAVKVTPLHKVEVRVNFEPRPLYPPDRTPYILENRLGGTQSRYGLFGGKTNLLPPPGFEPRMVLAVACSLHRMNQSRRLTSGPAG